MTGLTDRKVNVIRLISTSDGHGSNSKVEHVLHYNLPCKISIDRGNEYRSVGAIKDVSTYTMVCSVVDITFKDRVLDGSTRYEVLFVTNRDNRFLEVKLGLMT